MCYGLNNLTKGFEYSCIIYKCTTALFVSKLYECVYACMCAYYDKTGKKEGGYLFTAIMSESE